MRLNWNILGWTASAMGRLTPEEWAGLPSDRPADPPGKLPTYKHLPMMVARRLSPGCRVAVECAIEALERHGDVDAIVFASRHAELVRSERVLEAIAHNETPSPTDFTMSVHNAASGVLTIQRHLARPVSSVAAGPDTFEAGLIEAQTFLADGCSRVLLVTYENALTGRIGAKLPANVEPHALALVIERGGDLTATRESADAGEPARQGDLQWLEGYLSGRDCFEVLEGRSRWIWTRNR